MPMRNNLNCGFIFLIVSRKLPINLMARDVYLELPAKHKPICGEIG